MHDEAAAYYVDMIDQTHLGHTFIAQQFGTSALPTVLSQHTFDTLSSILLYILALSHSQFVHFRFSSSCCL